MGLRGNWFLQTLADMDVFEKQTHAFFSEMDMWI